jgi:hypothetical protein
MESLPSADAGPGSAFRPVREHQSLQRTRIPEDRNTGESEDRESAPAQRIQASDQPLKCEQRAERDDCCRGAAPSQRSFAGDLLLGGASKIVQQDDYEQRRGKCDYYDW